MNIYFACSITGGREDEGIYRTIVEHLTAEGHNVPTAHLAYPDIMTLESATTPEEVYTRDIKWINACDAIIAELSTPSHGVGYEISYALSREKPVLGCYSHGIKVSKMLIGNSNPRLMIVAYKSPQEAVTIVTKWLDKLQGSL